HEREAGAVEDGAGREHAARAPFVGDGTRHGHAGAPHQHLQRDREREDLAAPAELLRDRREEQAAARAHAERDEAYDAAAGDDQRWRAPSGGPGSGDRAHAAAAARRGAGASRIGRWMMAAATPRATESHHTTS